MQTLTPSQRILQMQYQLPIEAVIRQSLEKHRARPDLVSLCCADLGIGSGTFYRWTHMLQINVRDYHYVGAVNV